jgi:hypothetical protein
LDGIQCAKNISPIYASQYDKKGIEEELKQPLDDNNKYTLLEQLLHILTDKKAKIILKKFHREMNLLVKLFVRIVIIINA